MINLISALLLYAHATPPGLRPVAVGPGGRRVLAVFREANTFSIVGCETIHLPVVGQRLPSPWSRACAPVTPALPDVPAVRARLGEVIGIQLAAAGRAHVARAGLKRCRALPLAIGVGSALVAHPVARRWPRTTIIGRPWGLSALAFATGVSVGQVAGWLVVLDHLDRALALKFLAQDQLTPDGSAPIYVKSRAAFSELENLLRDALDLVARELTQTPT